ncbi:putative Coiled-coil domain-containing protein 174 [Nannochloris sp. 'desiccata']|nr:hypothetical protein KSW81_002931 [Chlorella desiccata (nom. nud.)]KAH7624750.1 putative Coiled-coil domain-containing protein 174 [Chlorella desiccata (nom. nud.)]
MYSYLRKCEAIGVSAASLVALKSQLAKKQEEVSGHGVRHAVLADARTKRPRGGGSVAALLQQRNPGVAERDREDRLSVKTGGDRLSESRAALERKAALYDRMSSGHMLEDEEAARYEVDFSLKERGSCRGGHNSAAGVGAGARGTDTTQAAVYTTTGALLSADMRQEQERRAWEERIHQESVAEEVADERRDVIEQLEKQTREGRDRAAIARQERQHAENRKKERLKAEFLKKKLEAAKKLATASKAAKGDGAGGG